MRPELQPAVKGGAEKRESREGHLLVFGLQVLLDEGQLLGEPLFKIGRGSGYAARFFSLRGGGAGHGILFFCG